MKSLQIIAFLALAPIAAFAQTSIHTQPRNIHLWGSGAASIDIYPAFTRAAHNTLVVIVPGGGFKSLSPYDRLLAEYFRAEGYPAAVVNYRTLPATYPTAVADVLRAIRLLRANELKALGADRILLLGESAGGMLASIAAVEPNLVNDPNDDLASTVSARPDLLLLLCPVITAAEDFRYRDVDLWLGDRKSEREQISPERHVTRDAPPALIFHAADDPIVPYEGSILFAQAYWKVGGDATLHIFPKGAHGFAFFNAPATSRSWREQALLWLEAHTTPAPQHPAPTDGTAH